jgi:hypothetical protein
MKQSISLPVAVCALVCLAVAGDLPAGYKGKPFHDETHNSGPQRIPGVLQCALYDLGGEGVAYHDTDTINHGSGELNRKSDHCRPGTPPYLCHFRDKEGVDISYVKSFADLNHENFATPEINQLYIGWEADGEWTNYTVDVKAAGTYRVIALYSNAANTIRFSLNGKPAGEYHLPVDTGSPHKWNKAEIGTIRFPSKGLQLLTLHYNTGNNLAYFEFLPAGR